MGSAGREDQAASVGDLRRAYLIGVLAVLQELERRGNLQAVFSLRAVPWENIAAYMFPDDGRIVPSSTVGLPEPSV